MLQIPGPRRGFTTGFSWIFFELLIVSKAANPPKNHTNLNLGFFVYSSMMGFLVFGVSRIYTRANRLT